MLGTKLATSSCLPVCGLETLREPLTPFPPSRLLLNLEAAAMLGFVLGPSGRQGQDRWKEVNCWVRRQVSKAARR